MGFLDSLFRRKPTQDQFATLFIAAVRQRGYTGELTYKADEFRPVSDTHLDVYKRQGLYKCRQRAYGMHTPFGRALWFAVRLTRR